MSRAGTRRAVVIGAGLGGLATALRLARDGWRVTICEKSPTPGGKMNRWQSGGYTFDTGPTLVTLPSVFRELYRHLGTEASEHVELVRLEEPFAYTFADGTRLAFSASLPELTAEAERVCPDDLAGLHRFLHLGARLFRLSEATFLRRPLSAPPDGAVWRELVRIPVRHAWGRYARAVAAHVRSPHLRQILNRYPTYVGSSPFSTPATLAMIPFMELAFGHWFVRGGLHEVVSSLVRLGEGLGVELRTDCPVTAIRQEGGRATGVETGSGEVLRADVVVMNAEASLAAGLLGRPNARPLLEERRSLSGLVLLLGLRRPLPGIPHHAVCFTADYAREFRELFEEGRFPDDPTVYVNVASRTDPGLAPPGGETLYLMANAPARDGLAWDGKAVGEARARILATLARAGFPDVSESVAVEDAWSPARLERTYGDPGGAIYGGRSHGWRGAFLRPPNRDPRLKGLYFVGGSTHPGGGTPTVLLSARIASGMILDDHGEGRP